MTGGTIGGLTVGVFVVGVEGREAVPIPPPTIAEPLAPTGFVCFTKSGSAFPAHPQNRWPGGLPWPQYTHGTFGSS